MFPHNSPNGRFQATNSNANGFSHQFNNAGFGFQQVPMYGNYQAQRMANIPDQQMMYQTNYQQNYLVSQQMQVQPMHRQPNPSADKHERYKLEQQRKFKNLGKSFKNTSIDSMLDDIVKVNTPMKKEPAVMVVPAVTQEDDFGDFLQAQTAVNSAPSPTDNQVAIVQPTANTSPSNVHVQSMGMQKTNEVKQSSQIPAVDLEAKMLASLDLNAPQQATRKFKPSLVDITAKVEGKTFQSSSKSANWSLLNVDETEFYVAPKEPVVQLTNNLPTQRYPQWIADPSALPLLYTQVWEACSSPDGMVDTAKVYPILLKSQLSNETLGQLWSIANTTTPGRLNQQELFVCLALIAETQNTEQLATLDMLFSLPCAPIPNLSGSIDPTPMPSHQPIQSVQQANVDAFNETKDTEDFDDFQEFQSVSAPIPTSVAPWQDQSDVHTESTSMSSKNVGFNFNPASAVTSHVDTSMQHNNVVMQQFKSNSDPKSDTFADFKSSQLDGNQSMPGFPPENQERVSDKYSAFEKITSVPMQGFDQTAVSMTVETLQPMPSSLQATDKYAVFDAIKPEGYQSATQQAPTVEMNNTDTLAQASMQQQPTDKYSAFASFSADNTPNGLQDFSSFSKPPEALSSPQGFTEDLSSTAASTETDKYSVFGALESDVPQGERNAFPPNIDPPSYSSIFDTEIAEPSGNQGGQADMEFGEFAAGFTAASNQFDNSHLSDKFNDTASTWTSTDQFIGSAVTEKATPKMGKADKISQLRDVETLSKTSGMVSGLSMPAMKLDADISHSKDASELKRTDSPYKMDVLSIKSDTNSVKSLEFTSLSQTILQQSMGTINNNAIKDNEFDGENEEKPANVSNDYGFEIDNDYSGFCEQPPEVPDTYDEEFNAYEEGTSHLTTFDAFEYHDNLKTKQDTQLTLPELPTHDEDSLQVKETGMKYSIEEMTITPGLHVGNNSDIDTEMERRIIETLSGKESNSARNALPSKPNQYTDQWERCLSACYNVIANTNEILSAIQSPSVCTEVVSSTKGSKFIADLSEVYAVACKICESARHWNMEREASKHLHKQIQLAWNNLLSLCPSVPTHELEEHGSPANNPCGVCLLAIKREPISYGGGQYHSTCANFWINCVASTLPSLRIPSAA